MGDKCDLPLYPRCITIVDNSIDIEVLEFEVKSADVADKAKEIAEADPGTIDPESINSQKIGHQLKKMRLKKAERKNRSDPRSWSLTIFDLRRWALSYGITLPLELAGDLKNQKADLQNNVVDTPHNIGDIGVVGDIGANNGGLNDQTKAKDEADYSWMRQGTI